MTKSQQQNESEWERISCEMPFSGMRWIVCNRFEKRESLIAEFAARFPESQHIGATAWGFEENQFEPYDWTSERLTLEAFLRLDFELHGGDCNGKPAILHFKAIEFYLARNSFCEFPTGEFSRALEKECAELCKNLPFALVFWSGPDCLEDMRRRMPAFHQKLAGIYRFATDPFLPNHIPIWICHPTWGNLGSFSDLDLTHTKLWEAYRLALAGKELQARKRISEVLYLAEQEKDKLTEGRCLVALGKGYMSEGNYAAAIELLSKGFSTHANDYELEDASEAVAILAELLIAMERYEEALIYLVEGYNRGGQYGWMPHKEIREQLSIVLQKLIPDRKLEALLLLYDKGFRLGETAIDGSLFTGRHPWGR